MIGERSPGFCTIMVKETPNFSEIVKFYIPWVKADLNVDSSLTIKCGNRHNSITFVYSGINSFQFRYTCMSEASLRKRRKKRRIKYDRYIGIYSSFMKASCSHLSPDLQSPYILSMLQSPYAECPFYYRTSSPTKKG